MSQMLNEVEQKSVEGILGKLEEIDKKLEKELRTLKVKYFKEKLPLYKQRDELLKKIPNFWLACFNNSPLSQHFNDEDTNLLQYISGVQVEVTEKYDKVILHFLENELIENSSLSKTVFVAEDISTKSDTLKWKKAPKRSKTESDNQFFKLFGVDETEITDIILDVYESPIEYYEADNDTEATRSNQTLSDNE
eukprot:NODE_425_length_8856_cov_0.734841.p4 type:complete len:193 gc:universal NODE_425_length_8856_cov_0.734841:890-312(-)